MSSNENGMLVQKTRDLCQAIIEQPEFKRIRERIDAFMANPDVQAQYQELSELGGALRHKQQMGMSADGPEFDQFEEKRQAFLDNPVASGFLEAQEHMHQMRETVNRYVTRTFELGRLPSAEDFESCSCDSGCGCGH
ncbi:MAG: YlbF family regulator [Verrucomicrobia bacterium]|jgi:cell fate (sporulation/competence/biofilm development) regulator YlbF (YheA/YmcA/DUF963 family)|nr:YlbF family regulator [Verrucomicrobiota bacterium]